MSPDIMQLLEMQK